MKRATLHDRPFVLISGAANGIGRACAEAFAECGAELILSDSDGTSLTRAADAAGGFSRFCDVMSETSVAVFAAELAERYPNLDVLINAAGNGYVRTLGMTHMSRAMLPLLRRGSGPRTIVNIEPAGGFSASDMFSYAGSHESFHRLSDALSDQTRGTLIDVVTIAPDVRLEASRTHAETPFYRVERVDEIATAARIAGLVTADWPASIHRGARGRRRA